MKLSTVKEIYNVARNDGTLKMSEVSHLFALILDVKEPKESLPKDNGHSVEQPKKKRGRPKKEFTDNQKAMLASVRESSSNY